MKGGSRVSSAAIMAQEEEDIRDYNLTEEQKAIKAKYPPAIRKYEYFSIREHSRGKGRVRIWRAWPELNEIKTQILNQLSHPDLDHTADVQLHAWGDTLEEAFEQCAMAMFGYMTDTGTVEPLQTVEVETQGDDLQSLLFHFLDEWLYKFSADEFFIPREVKVLQIDQRNFKLRSIGFYSFMIERSRDTGRGRSRSRLHTGSPMQD
ncbi:protein archease isoform X4 [Canis lupus baileyi]|uniref:protein archease isoform X4 n=1 Tax=Canis lupus dingo TaxID=286419 RepID=UPI000DC74B48|nr:protein archease isoform X4 [Canis lupus dingo]